MPRNRRTSKAHEEDLTAQLQSILDQIVEETDKNDRQLAEMFMELPDKDDYPEYYDVIDDPIAIDMIQVP